MKDDAMIHALVDYQMLVKDQEKRILSLAESLYFEQESEAMKTVNAFAVENEEIYLKLKRLIYDIQLRQEGNWHEDIGSTDSFPSTLTEIDDKTWRFTLPPFYSVNIKDRSGNAGKHMFYLIRNLIADYEINRKKIEVLDNPVVLFRHHICTDIQKPFDFDNIDSKRALDALQGVFLSDDNALSMTLLHEAIEDPDDSFCELYVIEWPTDELKQMHLFRRILAKKCD